MLSLCRTTKFRAAIIVMAVTLTGAPSYSFAQVTIDASKVTCDQFVHAKVGVPRTVAAWLSGFYNGKRGNAIIDSQNFETNLIKLEKFCYDQKNQGLTVMQAIEQALFPAK